MREGATPESSSMAGVIVAGVMSAAKSPTKCLACEGVLDGSLEHLFLHALGGTKKSGSLYCSTCNNRLGTEVDAPFANDFKFATTVLNVRRDRGSPPTLKVTTTDGQKIYLGPGGVSSVRGPSPTLIEERDGIRQITITVPVDKAERRHAQMLAKVAKEQSLAPSALGEPSMSLLTTSVGSVIARFAFGGSEHFRAVAKIALGFLALEIGDDVFTEPYEALRQAVVHGKDVGVWLQPRFDAFVAPLLPPTDGVQHRVLIYTTGSETWAYVEVYGSVGYAVLLAEIPDARFVTPYVWGQNPTNGKHDEGRAPGMPVPTPIRTGVALATEDILRQAMASLLMAMYKVNFETAWDHVIDKELAIAFAGLGEGAEISVAFIYELSQRIAQRFAALHPSNRSLNLSRGITNRAEFERIRRALGAVVGPRKK